MSGDIWYVNSNGGADAAAPRGKERIRPLATFAQAVTNAAANDIIVLMSGHTETDTSGLTLSLAGLTVLGEGSGSSRPKITRDVAGQLWGVSGAGITIDNVYFPASVTATSTGRIRVASANVTIRRCYFESGTSDDGPALELLTGCSGLLLEDTTFISTAASAADQPASAIAFTNAITHVKADAVVIDGASSGWANPYAVVGTSAVTRLLATNIDLLNDSDVTLATGTVGHFHVRNKSGSARVVWAA